MITVFDRGFMSVGSKGFWIYIHEICVYLVLSFFFASFYLLVLLGGGGGHRFVASHSLFCCHLVTFSLFISI